MRKGICCNTGRTHIKKGQHLSPNTEFKKGLVPWNKGKKGLAAWNNAYCYKECEVCGNLFKLKPSHWNLRKTCSRECLGLLKSKKAKENPFWKGKQVFRKKIESLEQYSLWRNEVFKRDNYQCSCGVRGKIFAHHKKPFAEIVEDFLKEYNQFSLIEDKETLLRLSFTYKPFWNIDNGKTHCEKCHRKKHRRKYEKVTVNS